MPPKSVVGASKTGLTQEEFLAACFQCAKEKITIDYDKLAIMTGMSRGGAQNKFRDVTKKLEALAPAATGFDSNTVEDPKTTSTKTKTSRKRKLTPPANTSNSDDTINAKDDVMVADGPKPSIKKTKASITKKETAKVGEKRGKKVEAKSKEIIKAAEDEGEDENMKEECEQGEQGKVGKKEDEDKE